MTWSVWNNNLPIASFDSHLHPDTEEVLVVALPGAIGSEITSSADSSNLWPSIGIFEKYRSLISINSALFKESSEQPLIVIGKNQDNWILIVQPEHHIFNDFPSAAKLLWPSSKWTQSSNQLFQLEGDKWVGKISQGLLVISNSATWINIPQNPLSIDSSFDTAVQQRGKSAMCSWIINDPAQKKWTCLDISLKSGELLANGYLPISNRQFMPQGEFSKIPEVPLEYSSILALPVADSESLWKNNEEYFASVDSLSYFNNLVSEYEVNANCNLKESMSSWPSDIAIQLSNEEKSIVLISHRSSLNTSVQLKAIADSAEVLGHLGFNILQLKNQLNASILLHHSFTSTVKFYAITDDFVLFSDKAETIIKYLDDVALGRTADLLKEESSSEYINRRSSLLAMNSHVDIALPAAVEEFLRWSRDGNKASLNCIRESDASVLLNMVVTGSESMRSTRTTELWSIPLDGTFSRKPELVVNHYTSEKEVIIQDTNNQLYLISASGKVLWKKDLKSNILGEIMQIDIFKNGKLQLIFATENHIHLLDRNGNYVDAFPLKLPSKASSALSVFDYDKDKTYRLTIGCEDGMIYNYTTEGKNTKGWKYKNSNEAVTWLNHFKLGSKDYILTIGKQGQIQLLQRNGKGRTEVDTRAKDWMAGAIYLQLEATIAESGIIYSDRSGKIHSLSFGGKATTLFQTQPPANQVHFEDITNNGRPNVIATAKNSLSIYKLNSEIIWTKEFDANPGSPGIYKFGRNDSRIGIQAGEEIWLLNNDGQAVQGFPITGNTPLTIGDLKRDGQLQMIYGKAGRYLINQRVQ